MSMDFNGAGPQRDMDVIPANTICVLQMNIRPGGAGDGGWLRNASDGASMGLDCEFVVADPEQFAKRKLWQWFTIEGTTPGHAEAGEISRNALRAILESARGVRPNDTSEAAQKARQVAGWADFNGIRFVAQLGVRPPKDGYGAKNTILKVITPERQVWRKPEQVPLANGGAAAATPSATAKAAAPPPPANAIARPQWGE
jgi:hypothetical protein